MFFCILRCASQMAGITIRCKKNKKKNNNTHIFCSCFALLVYVSFIICKNKMQTVLSLKQVTKLFNQFCKNWQQVQNDYHNFEAITKIYCEGLINKVPLEHIPFYVDEYFMKVAAMYDVVDTLEFGKMRSETQKLLHKSYISTTLKGGFLASAYEGEQDIELSFCSHEGLKVQLRLMAVIVIICCFLESSIISFIY